jgi:hypothetical protein
MAKKAVRARRKAAPKTVNRTLVLGSPAAKGADVRALQVAINKEFRHRKLEWRCVKATGKLDKATLRAAVFLLFVLGISARRSRAALPTASRPHLSEALQHIIRNPETRSALDRGREKLRKSKVQQIREKHASGPAAAIAFLRKLAAEEVHEIGESNRGPWVDKFEKLFGLIGDAWCGMCAGWVAIKIGRCLSSGLSFWNGYKLIEEAHAGADGCYLVDVDRIEGGEILVYWGGEHVGTAVAGWDDEEESVETVEGNTSPNSGNDEADGGCVAVKHRTAADISAAIRIYG